MALLTTDTRPPTSTKHVACMCAIISLNVCGCVAFNGIMYQKITHHKDATTSLRVKQTTEELPAMYAYTHTLMTHSDTATALLRHQHTRPCCILSKCRASLFSHVSRFNPTDSDAPLHWSEVRRQTKIIPQLNYLTRQILGFLGLYKDQNIVFIIFYLTLLTAVLWS